MTRLEVRNIRAGEVAAVVRAELGVQGETDGLAFRGDGWSLAFIPGEPASVGRYRVPVLFIEIEGEREPEVAALLRRKLMRGGG